MSREATDWAFAQRPPHPADMAVLLALANAHNRKTRVAFPSVAHLVDCTRWQRKVVLASLTRLQVLGYVRDTGERTGKTRQIKVWRLAFDDRSEADDE